MLREIVLVPATIGALPAVSPTPRFSAGILRQCRAELVQSLSDKYKEAPTAVGQIDGTAVIEVFVSDKGSWTILATGTDGRSCVVFGGRGFRTQSGSAWRRRLITPRCGLGMVAQQRHQPGGLVFGACLVAVEDRADQGDMLVGSLGKPGAGLVAEPEAAAVGLKRRGHAGCKRIVGGQRDRLVQRLVGCQERQDIAGDDRLAHAKRAS